MKHNDKLHGHIGPGGIKCSCCTPYNTVKKNREWLNKIKRGLIKRFIRKELQEIEKE